MNAREMKICRAKIYINGNVYLPFDENEENL